MIRKCTPDDTAMILEIINDAASVYNGVIPDDCWHSPYMSEPDLRFAIEIGVVFYGFENHSGLIGIMGIQEKKDVTLIRHAYVRTIHRNSGIGSQLLAYLKTIAKHAILIGTWTAADWAIRFYEKNGFELVSREETERLLKKYWEVSERQIETSVVLRQKELRGV